MRMSMGDTRSVHPKNAAGPFYVVDGCCTGCGVPTSIAPDLFEYDASDHCYVARQPSSAPEIEEAVQVIRAQELGCIRYRGNDAVILRRLAEAGEADQCDHPLPGVGVVLRNVVTFAVQDSSASLSDAAVRLQDFAAYLQREYPDLR